MMVPVTINPAPISRETRNTAAIPVAIRIKPKMPMTARKVIALLSIDSSGSCVFGLVFGLVFCFGFGMAVKEMN